MNLSSRSRLAENQNMGTKAAVTGLIVLCGFFICRTAVWADSFPCAIAFVSVMIAADRINFYMLPVAVLGICSWAGCGIYIWGDVASVCICSLLFLLVGEKDLSIEQKAAAVCSVTAVSRCVYYSASGILYALDIRLLLLQLGLIVFLLYEFQSFYMCFINKKGEGGREKKVVAAVTVFMLVIAGTGLEIVILCGAMIITGVSGYVGSASEGTVAGFASGVILILTGGNPGWVIVLASAGLAAGLLSGQNRFTAGICFAAVSMAFGIFDTTLVLSMPWQGPVSGAVALFILYPEALKVVKDKAESVLGESSTTTERNPAALIKKSKECFDTLAAIYASTDKNRDDLTCQFSGMAQSLKGIIEDLDDSGNREIKFKTEAGCAKYAKINGISGDTYRWIDLDRGVFAAVVSDGMGKGESAARESNLTVSTVINLICAGFTPITALKTANSMLRNKVEDEMFSTIDLFIFDKTSGKAKMYKAGAAASFIKRKDKIEMIRKSTVPLGIIENMKSEAIEVQLESGDEVILMSDGVSDARREDVDMGWLKDGIERIKSKDPQTMSDLIMQQAIRAYGEKELDDLTVLTVRVV